MATRDWWKRKGLGCDEKGVQREWLWRGFSAWGNWEDGSGVWGTTESAAQIETKSVQEIAELRRAGDQAARICAGLSELRRAGDTGIGCTDCTAICAGPMVLHRLHSNLCRPDDP